MMLAEETDRSELRVADLTGDSAKALLYADDIYVRQGFFDVNSTGIDGIDVDIRRHALLVIKPCGLYARKVEKILTWLDEQEFDVVNLFSFTITPEVSRTLWQYSLNGASIPRLWVMDRILGTCASLGIVLRSRTGVDAAHALSSRKGPANKDRQVPGQLRYELKPESFLLNFIHASDDALDVVRELQILKLIGSDVLPIEEIVRAEAIDIDDVRRRSRRYYENLPEHTLRLGDALRDLGRPDLAELDAESLRARVDHGTEAGVLAGISDTWRDKPVSAAVVLSHILPMSDPDRRTSIVSISGTT